MESLKLAALALVIGLSSCGSYDNPRDPALGDEDYDNDGLLNKDDPHPTEPDNPVKTPDGQTKTTSNIASGWTFYDGVATYDAAVQQAPSGFSVPSLADIKDAYTAGKFSTLSQPVWTSTVAEDRSDQVYIFDLKQGTAIKALKTASYRSIYRSK